MLRFRVTHSEPKRVVLTWHGETGETGRIELMDTEGATLGEHFTAGAYFDVHLHPEDGPLHAHVGDDSKDLGSAEEETDTIDDKDAEIARLRAALASAGDRRDGEQVDALSEKLEHLENSSAPPHPLDAPVVTTTREVLALAPEIARAAAEPSEPPKE